MVTGHRGCVVVTGASTGIGEAIALRLSRAGFEVFAGVRREHDAERLRALGMRPLTLDVRNEADIAAAAEEVHAALEETRLVGLVNNAGVVVPSPVELVPLEGLREQLEVNVIGPVAVIQTFLPLLRAGRGRIVNIGSIDGKLATPLLGPYAASKFAMEGLSDVLRRELRSWRIQVAIVEPGAIRTPIWEKGRRTGDQLFEQSPPEAERLYRPLVDAIRAESLRLEQESSISPDAVARAVEHALTARRARTRYLVGRDARIKSALAWLLPDRGLDVLVARVLKL